MEAPENGGAEMMLGEEAVEGHTPTGGVSGFAKGLMQKGMSIKVSLHGLFKAVFPNHCYSDYHRHLEIIQVLPLKS